MKVLLAALFLPCVAFAECPPGPDISASEETLHADLVAAPDEQVARTIANDLWRLWMQAPDAQAQGLLERAMERRVAFDLAASESLLDELTTYCPDYVEGFNQRAFVRFLREDFEGALRDIDRVLTRKPAHFGALSGKALTLMRLGRFERGQRALREAVEVHPWLDERHMLATPPEREL